MSAGDELGAHIGAARLQPESSGRENPPPLRLRCRVGHASAPDSLTAREHSAPAAPPIPAVSRQGFPRVTLGMRNRVRGTLPRRLGIQSGLALEPEHCDGPRPARARCSSPSPSRSTSSFRASPSGCRPISPRSRCCGLRTGEERYRRIARFWTQDLRRVVRAWASCRASCCPTSSAPTGAASRRRRQHHRPAGRLRGADRVLPRSDLPRHPAVRRQPRAALAARAFGDRRRGRHRDLGVLDPVRQQLDAHAGRPRDARRRRLSARLVRHHLQSELSLSLRPHAQRLLSHHRLRRARGRRALPARRPRTSRRRAPCCAWRSGCSPSWRRCSS